MDDTLTLFVLSMAMLLGCYLAGSIPLAFSLSEEKLKRVTIFGAGLLVGAALAVIIPEGVHTLYDSHQAHQTVQQNVGKGEEIVPDNIKKEEESHEHHHHHEDGYSEMHTWIGVALVLGFIFMLLVDQFSGSMHQHTQTDSESNSTKISTSTRGKTTATIGLVVHAAADGVALGAAATTSQTHVELIVFIAIMLHKAPAAFGLVSFLLHDGLERSRIRKHLLIFSCAAPLLAMLTYFGLSQQNKDTLTQVNGTGVAMLFSAGTFLYVATVHVLPELASMGSTKTQLNDGSTVIREHKGFTNCELILMVSGALLPLVLSLTHHH